MEHLVTIDLAISEFRRRKQAGAVSQGLRRRLSAFVCVYVAGALIQAY